MNRLVVLLILCSGLGITPKGCAQEASPSQPTQTKLPPLADIEAWITDNLPAQVDEKYRSKAIDLETQEIAFQGCKATFTDTFAKYKNQDRPSSKGAVTTTVIDLAKLTPDSVVVFQGEPAIQIHSERGITTHTRDWILSTNAILHHQTEPDEMVEDDDQPNVFGYYVSDADIAARTVHAWRDAIQTCTAKAVPKNLY
jgi:hypothetical protein